MIINYDTLALLNLVPNCQFAWYGTEWEGLEWKDSRPQPTKKEWEKEVERLKIILPIQERQKQIQKLLLESDYIELPSFLERKGQGTYNTWMTYRENLRLAYHDSSLPIPETPI